jgi:hypothetical protein
MTKNFTFNTKLDENQPSTFVTEWKTRIKFTLTSNELQENTNTKKEYKGYYWWNSKGEEYIEWITENEKTKFKDSELAKTTETAIIKEVKRELEKLARKKQIDILWDIPFKKDIKVGAWLLLKEEKNLPNKRKLISVPITLHLGNQRFKGKYQVEVKEKNIMVDYNFEWETVDQEKMLYGLNFYSDYQEDVKNLLNDLLEVEETYDLENTTQE